MPSIYDLKPAFQSLLLPATRTLARTGVSANQVTLGAMFLSLGAGATIALFPGNTWPLLLLPAVLLVRMALNAIDGTLAREHGMMTPLGAVLNELGDVVSDVALFLPLVFIPGLTSAPIILFTVLAILAEFAGVVAVQIGAQRRYDGPLGKSDRALFLGLVAIALGFDPGLSVWLGDVFWIASALLVVTIFNRTRNALQQVTS